MNRRGFLKFLGVGTAGIALAEAIPFGRVWSFPSKIVVPKPVLEATITHYADGPTLSRLATVYYDRRALDLLESNLMLAPYENIEIPKDEKGRITFAKWQEIVNRPTTRDYHVYA